MKMNERPNWKLRVKFPEAESVYLVGPFNNWSTVDTPMERTASGDWTTSLPVGEYHCPFSFFVWDHNATYGRVVRDDQALYATTASLS